MLQIAFCFLIGFVISHFITKELKLGGTFKHIIACIIAFLLNNILNAIAIDMLTR